MQIQSGSTGTRDRIRALEVNLDKSRSDTRAGTKLPQVASRKLRQMIKAPD